MITNKQIIIASLILVAVAGSVYFWQKKSTSNESRTPDTETSVRGCYVARLAKDVYVLHVATQNNEDITGSLQYKNFQKDSSSGPLIGTYKDNILLGNYSFASEGLNSEREVIFKKVGNTFVQGFGPVTVTGDKETFVNSNDVVFDSKLTFIFISCNDLTEDLQFDLSNLPDK